MLCKPLIRMIARNSINYAGRNSIVRNSGHAVAYRSAPAPASKATRISAETFSALMWWWVLWHIWHEPEHITGEFPYPDPSKWSNKELGIPRE